MTVFTCESVVPGTPIYLAFGVNLLVVLTRSKYMYYDLAFVLSLTLTIAPTIRAHFITTVVFARQLDNFHRHFVCDTVLRRFFSQFMWLSTILLCDEYKVVIFATTSAFKNKFNYHKSALHVCSIHRVI